MTRMLITGPPGAGKGTQAELISKRVGVHAISTGEIFRTNVKGRTHLGQMAKKYLDCGDLVPDSVTNGMVGNRLAQPDVKSGFVLDGYPRTLAQVEYLDALLAEGTSQLDMVIQLTANDSELIARLLGRRKETGRSDDRVAVVQHRLSLYYQQTQAVVAEYSNRGILVQIDGSAPVPVVTKRAMEAITSALNDDRGNSGLSERGTV